MSRLRLLQIVGSTDPDPATVDALGLHTSIAEAGIEVRTLAMAPGRRGGLDSQLPVMAPSRRSFAARTAVLGEQRWADVVVFHGLQTLTLGAWPAKGSPPRLVHLTELPTGLGAVSLALARGVAQRADLVTTGGDATADAIDEVLGVPEQRQRRVESVDEWLVLLSGLRPESQ